MPKIRFAPAAVSVFVGLAAAWIAAHLSDSPLTIGGVGVLALMFAYGKCMMDEKAKLEHEKLIRTTERESAAQREAKHSRRDKSPKAAGKAAAEQSEKRGKN